MTSQSRGPARELHRGTEPLVYNPYKLASLVTLTRTLIETGGRPEPYPLTLTLTSNRNPNENRAGGLGRLPPGALAGRPCFLRSCLPLKVFLVDPRSPTFASCSPRTSWEVEASIASTIWTWASDTAS